MVLGPSQCCFWQNLDYRNPQTYKKLITDYKLENTVAEALCDEETRPRYFKSDKGLVIILRGINQNKGSDADDMISLRIWIDKEKIITLSHRKISTLEDVFNSLLNKKGPLNTSQCFIAIADRLAENILDTSSDITNKTDDLESEVIDVDNLSDFELRGSISELRREIISIKRYASPQKDIFQYLQTDTIIFNSDEMHSALREVFNTLQKALEDLDYSKEHLSVSLEELQSKMSINMNRIMYMISIATVVFLPLGLMTSLLGINVNGIPFANKEWAFGGVCLLLVVICFILLGIMKKMRWL